MDQWGSIGPLVLAETPQLSEIEQCRDASASALFPAKVLESLAATAGSLETD